AAASFPGRSASAMRRWCRQVAPSRTAHRWTGLASKHSLAGLPGDFLLREQRTVNLVADADAAGFGEASGVFVGEERPPDAGCALAAHRAVAGYAGEHLLNHAVQKYRFVILCRGVRLGVLVERIHSGFAGPDAGAGRCLKRLVERR